jgi:glutamine synthetase
MAKTMIAPAAITYQGELADTIKAVSDVGVGDTAAAKDLLGEVNEWTGKLLTGIKDVEAAAAGGEALAILKAQDELREAADSLESVLPNEIWPLPTYTEMLFMY